MTTTRTHPKIIDTCDLLVIGGGIGGITYATEYKRRNPTADVILVEKYGRLGGRI
jgi:hypothetical protein